MSEENTENKKPSNIESALEEETETVEQPVLTELRNVDYTEFEQAISSFEYENEPRTSHQTTTFGSQSPCQDVAEPFTSSTDFEGKPLISAIAAKDLKQAKMALKNYSTLRQIDGHGNTALHHAAENGFMEAIKLLIKYKCGLNSTNNMGFTPLIVALQNYHTEVAKELLNAGASAYILSPKFDSALGLAIKLNERELVNRIFAQPCEVDLRMRNLYCALGDIAENGIESYVNLLILNGADLYYPMFEVDPPLCTSIKYGYPRMVKKWLSVGAPIERRDMRGYTPLMIAAEYNRIQITRILLWHGANRKALVFGQTALDIAKAKGNEMVAYLLETVMMDCAK